MAQTAVSTTGTPSSSPFTEISRASMDVTRAAASTDRHSEFLPSSCLPGGTVLWDAACPTRHHRHLAVYRRLPTAAAHGIRPGSVCRGSWLSCFFWDSKDFPPCQLLRMHSSLSLPQQDSRGNSRHSRPNSRPLLPRDRRGKPASETPEQDVDHAATYAQTVSSLIPVNAGDPLTLPSSPPQPPAWSETRAPKRGLLHRPRPRPPCTLSSHPFTHHYTPHQMVPHPHHQPHPSWQAYFQAIPTKEDFKQLIEDVKSTCRAEIQVI